MTIKEAILKAWDDISCSYGNHKWGDYTCDYYGFYHLLYTRRCENCGKIEGNKKPFKEH